MPTLVQVSLQDNEWHVRGEIDLTTAGAILATRGRGLVFTKTGTGVYTVRVVGYIFKEVLARQVQLHAATPTPAYAEITGIDLDGAGDGTGAVITITTLDDNATPAAANIAAGTISLDVVFRMYGP